MAYLVRHGDARQHQCHHVERVDEAEVYPSGHAPEIVASSLIRRRQTFGIRILVRPFAAPWFPVYHPVRDLFLRHAPHPVQDGSHHVFSLDRRLQVGQVEVEGEVAAVVVLHLLGGGEVHFEHVHPLRAGIISDVVS